MGSALSTSQPAAVGSAAGSPRCRGSPLPGAEEVGPGAMRAGCQLGSSCLCRASLCDHCPLPRGETGRISPTYPHSCEPGRPRAQAGPCLPGQGLAVTALKAWCFSVYVYGLILSLPVPRAGDAQAWKQCVTGVNSAQAAPFAPGSLPSCDRGRRAWRLCPQPPRARPRQPGTAGASDQAPPRRARGGALAVG